MREGQKNKVGVKNTRGQKNKVGGVKKTGGGSKKQGGGSEKQGAQQNVRKYVPNICAYIDLDNKNACLRTSASFWENGVHEWETNDVRSRATYTEEVKEPQWQASGFMVCTRHEM